MNIQNHYLTNKTKKRNWGNKGSFRKQKKIPGLISSALCVCFVTTFASGEKCKITMEILWFLKSSVKLLSKSI